MTDQTTAAAVAAIVPSQESLLSRLTRHIIPEVEAKLKELWTHTYLTAEEVYDGLVEGVQAIMNRLGWGTHPAVAHAIASNVMVSQMLDAGKTLVHIAPPAPEPEPATGVSSGAGVVLPNTGATAGSAAETAQGEAGAPLPSDQAQTQAEADPALVAEAIAAQQAQEAAGDIDKP